MKGSLGTLDESHSTRTDFQSHGQCSCELMVLGTGDAAELRDDGG